MDFIVEFVIDDYRRHKNQVYQIGSNDDSSSIYYYCSNMFAKKQA